MIQEKTKKAERLETAMRDCFKNDPSREILWEILKETGVYQANFGGTDFERGVNEGKRRVGLFLEMLLAAIETQKLAEWKVASSRRDYAETMANEAEDDFL